MFFGGFFPPLSHQSCLSVEKNKPDLNLTNLTFCVIVLCTSGRVSVWLLFLDLSVEVMSPCTSAFCDSPPICQKRAILQLDFHFEEVEAKIAFERPKEFLLFQCIQSIGWQTRTHHNQIVFLKCKKADAVLSSSCQAGGTDTQVCECDNSRTSQRTIFKFIPSIFLCHTESVLLEISGKFEFW